MSHLLDGIRAKIQRAEEHIRHIHDEVMAGRVGESQGDPVRAVYDRSTNEWIFRLRNCPTDPPLLLSILTGEALYQLRSALDHLVFELIVTNTMKGPEIKSQFPVIGKGTKSKPDPAAHFDDTKAAMIRGVSQSAEERIKKLQPFQRGAYYDQDPLWELTQLNNADKHQMPVLTVHGVAMYRVTVSTPQESVRGDFYPAATQFEDGAEIGRLHFSAPFRPSELRIEGDLVLGIAFSNICGRQNVPLILKLQHLARYVSQIVDVFEPEFS